MHPLDKFVFLREKINNKIYIVQYLPTKHLASRTLLSPILRL